MNIFKKNKSKEEGYLHKAKEFMKNYPQITAEFRGCSENEILGLENKLNIKLPEAYKEFLLWFGHSGGKILRGTDYYYYYISNEMVEGYIEDEIYREGYTFKQIGIDLLNRNKFDGEKIMKDSFMFMCHQGYAIEYLNLSEGENPPVYIFVQQNEWLEKGPTVWAETYSEYLYCMLKDEINALKKINQL